MARRFGLAAVVAVIAVGTVGSLDAEAKRLGGGRTVGRQTQTTQSAPSSPTQQSTQQPMMQSAQPSQAQRTQSTPGAQPAPATQRSRWLGPIAGLAAGLGIAALLSHFGLGGAFASMMANVIVIALLAMAGIWLIRKLTSRGRRQPAAAYAGGTGMDAHDFARQRMQAPAAFGGASPAAARTAPEFSTQAALPAGFDAEAFVRNAKVHFVRMQAAWDEGNMADIREFTTPEMFAELKIDIDARGKVRNQTDVVQLDADVLGVEDRGTEYLASVRFTGLIRETEGGSAEPFEEIWNLSKQARGNEGWLLAGISQTAHH
ncbi:TIM44-like domain-containing protein [Trinickia caryophylli]|uniref:Tim44 domain-containing protein n=1 Tax=Trinickia caryophylli TaxID=28094 RepID=UPI000A157A14|nr:TIM44-like domain-containing protein [Trinickia caryophylli]PMS12207.1 hypothetical protein C0Z17_11020 [Trinickia caryophylli]TRX20294.1 hypothetical protein FNF07_10410 [Trinickia caryophylli]WQE13711.1 TIM44-like domain-containing protein [Trinickia caryophylli]